MKDGYLRVLRERWRLIIVVMICALTGAGLVTALLPPTYTSKITMYVSARSAGDNAADVYQASLLAQERTRQYAQLVTSTRVSQLVAQRLGLSANPEELASRIEASSSLESVILEVSVKASSADEAAAIANSVGQVFPGLVADIEQRPAIGGAPVTIRVVDGASTPSTQTLELLLFNLALGVLGGLVVGIGSAFALNAFNPSQPTVPASEDRGRPPLRNSGGPAGPPPRRPQRPVNGGGQHLPPPPLVSAGPPHRPPTDVARTVPSMPPAQAAAPTPTKAPEPTTDATADPDSTEAAAPTEGTAAQPAGAAASSSE